MMVGMSALMVILLKIHLVHRRDGEFYSYVSWRVSVDICDISFVLWLIKYKNIFEHSVVKLLDIDLPYVPVL